MLGGVAGVVSEPLDVPPVGEVRTPGVVTGVPFPRVRSVVQPNAASEAERENARSVRAAGRWLKLLCFKALLI
jgi:hypothetical protein